MDPLLKLLTLHNLVIDAIITFFPAFLDNILEPLILVLILILFFVGAVVVKKLPHGVVLGSAVGLKMLGASVLLIIQWI